MYKSHWSKCVPCGGPHAYQDSLGMISLSQPGFPHPTLCTCPPLNVVGGHAFAVKHEYCSLLYFVMGVHLNRKVAGICMDGCLGAGQCIWWGKNMMDSPCSWDGSQHLLHEAGGPEAVSKGITSLGTAGGSG